jgi:ribosomal protein L16 Arg81 hydroxylase
VKKHGSRLIDNFLAHLIAPVPLEEFFANYFEQKSLVVHRDQPAYFEDLLTLNDLDRVLTTLHLSAEQLDIVNTTAGTTIKKSDYIKPNGIADPVRVAGLFANGGTIIFQQLNHNLTKLAEFCADLEVVFTQKSQMNVYLTPPGSQGFKSHYDGHDVFVVQIEGSKTWNLYSTPLKFPLEGRSFDSSTDNPGSITCSFELRKGDVLYIPRGLVHDARATKETSVHITVGVHCYTWADLMTDALSRMCLDDPAFRRSLPPGFARQDFNRDEPRAYFRELLEAFSANSDFDHLFDGIADHFIGTREMPVWGQLKAMDPSHRLTAQDLLAPRRHLIYRLTHGPQRDQITLRAHGVELTLPALVESAVRYALEHSNYRASDLPAALPANDKVTLASRLLREGIIERVAIGEGVLGNTKPLGAFTGPSLAPHQKPVPVAKPRPAGR